MLKRDKLLSHIRQEEDRKVLVRILDKAESVLRSHQVEVSDFLDPRLAELALSILRGIDGIDFTQQGGYPEAERCRMVMCPDYLVAAQEDASVALLRLSGNFDFQEVTHRDLLGAMMSLGLRREKIGDLIVGDKGCQVFVAAEVASYILMNLTRIHRVTVRVEEVPFEEFQAPAPEGKEMEATVASLRLDAVAGVVFGTSRSKVVEDIGSGKMKVNWQEVQEGDHPMKAGDVLSCRGRGRAALLEVKGETKRGRIGIRFRRYQ